MVASAWIFGKHAWTASDHDDPRRMFVQEVATSVGATIHWNNTRQVSLKVVSPRLWFKSNHNHHHSE
jgi:hypothetical protein